MLLQSFIFFCSIIGLLIGTCVAFFVIIGDLGPVIISKVLGIEVRKVLCVLIPIQYIQVQRN